MSPLESKLFRNVFESVAAHLPIESVGRLARCSQTLKQRVDSLSLNFWARRIHHDFKISRRDIAVKWIRWAKNTQLAKLSYVACRFLTSVPVSITVAKGKFLPLPVLCSWLLALESGEMFDGELVALWKILPEDDRQIFYELTSQRVLEELEKICSGESYRWINDSDLSLTGDFLSRGWGEKLIKYPVVVLGLLIKFCQKNDYPMIDRLLLLISGQHKDVMLTLCLQRACSGGGDTSTVRKLIEAGADHSKIPDLLHKVVTKEGKNELVSLLVESGAQVTGLDRKGRTPLGKMISKMCTFIGDGYALRMLVSRGDLRTLQENCWWILVREGTADLLNILQELGAYTVGQRSFRGSTVLHAAQIFGGARDLDFLRALLEAGEDPNAVNDDHLSPLCFQMQQCQSVDELVGLCKLFEEYGFDYKKYPTLLHHVCRQFEESGEAVRFLLEQGLDTSAVDSKGQRAIDYALKRYLDGRKVEDVIEAFLEAGVSLPDTPSKKIDFFFACRFGLVEKIKNWEGKLPVDYQITISPLTPLLAAIEKGHLGVVKILLDKIGIGCLTICSSYIGTAAKILDRKRRREMVHFLFDTFKDLSWSDSTGICELVKCCDYQLFQEILLKMPEEESRCFLEIYKERLAKYSLKAHRLGRTDILEKMIQLLPKTAWTNYSPLIALLSHRDACAILPGLYADHPEWLNFKYEGQTILEEVCHLLVTCRKEQREQFFSVFQLILGWLQKLPNEQATDLYDSSLSYLFGEVLDFPDAMRQALYDVFLIQEQMNKSYWFKSALESIVCALPSSSEPKKHWEELWPRLEKLQFGWADILKTTVSFIDKCRKYDREEICPDYLKFITVVLQSLLCPRALDHWLVHVAVALPDDVGNHGSEISVHIIRQLIAFGFSLNEQNDKGNTPLHTALITNNIPAAIYLIEAGADLDIKNNERETAGTLAHNKNSLQLSLAMNEPYCLMLNKENKK